jgi:hypothetical protein
MPKQRWHRPTSPYHGVSSFSERARWARCARLPARQNRYPTPIIAPPQARNPISHASHLVGRHRLIDMMDAKQMVIDQTLDSIEHAPAKQRGAGDQLA